MIINSISGPRNISTALMYSFAQHSQVKVVDEPFYAHYLLHTGMDHPGREEIIQSMPGKSNEVLENIKKLDEQHSFVFLKNMAHHHAGLDWQYLLTMKNFFLIRDPKQLIASFIKVIPNPTIQDIGLKHEAELLDYIVKNSKKNPIVLDSNQLLKNPKRALALLCDYLGIKFENSMLSWKPRPITEDGIWAKYWYKNVHASIGFSKQQSKERELPQHCKPLYEEAMQYYEHLQKFSLKI